VAIQQEVVGVAVFSLMPLITVSYELRVGVFESLAVDRWYKFSHKSSNFFLCAKLQNFQLKYYPKVRYICRADSQGSPCVRRQLAVRGISYVMTTTTRLFVKVYSLATT